MKKVILITLMLVAAMSLTSYAQPGSCDGPRGGQGMGQRGGHGMGHGQQRNGMGLDRLLRLADRLELTEAQQERLEKLRYDFKMEMVDTRADLQKAKIELKTLMHKDDASTSAVNSAIDDVAGKGAAMSKLRFAHRSEAKSLLTAEQQAKLKELRLEHRGGKGDRKFGQRRGHSGQQDNQMGQRRHQNW